MIPGRRFDRCTMSRADRFIADQWRGHTPLAPVACRECPTRKLMTAGLATVALLAAVASFVLTVVLCSI